MQASVRAAWHAFSEPLEGRVHSLYVDVKGLVTTGVGNLVEPVALALQLPWKHPDGKLATAAEVAEQWHRVKNDRERLKDLHYRFAAELTTIRLTDEDVDALVERKLAENEAFITREWLPAFPQIPADAQLAILSMAWAVGSAFNRKFPIFTAQAKAQRWWDCATLCKIREDGNPGVVPRNKANRLCFENAAAARAQGTDPSVLHWPNPHPQPQAAAAPPPAFDRALRAEATAAATEARFDALEAGLRDAHRQMSGDPDDEEDPDE